MQNLVSIVIPVYNSEEYLSDCLDSVISQSYNKLEIICIDDGSNDSSLDILNKYQDKDSRVRIFSQKNRGAGKARNVGLYEAKGEYICFWDADDYFKKNAIEKMIHRAQETKADIVLCNIKTHDMRSSKVYSVEGVISDAIIKEFGDYFSPLDFLQNVFFLSNGWPWDKLYRRDFLIKNKIEFQNTKVSNDIRFSCVSLVEADRITKIFDDLIIHRENCLGSIQSTRFEKWKDFLCVFYSLRDELLKRNKFELYDNAFVKVACYHLVLGYISAGMPYDNFVELYMTLRKKAATEFDFERLLKMDVLNDTEKYIRDEIAAILSLEPEEYIERVISRANQFIKEYSIYTKELERRIDDMACYTAFLEEEKQWPLDLSVFPTGARILVYGYGDAGKDYVHQINQSRTLKLTGVVDRDKEKDDEYFELYKPEEIVSLEYDYIVISIRDHVNAGKIRSYLVETGVPENKIVWQGLKGDSGC